MTTSWVSPQSDGRAIKNGRRLERPRGHKLLPGLTRSAALIGLIAIADTAPDIIFAHPAFAGSRAAHSNNGNGNRGVDQGRSDIPGAATTLDDDRAGLSSQARRDDKGGGKGAADTDADFDLPVGEQLTLGRNDSDFLDDLGKIDYPGKIDARELPAAATRADPKGKALGLRRKQNLDAADASEAKKSTSASNRLAVDPRFYSHREVLALNLSSVAIARLHQLGFSRGISTRIGEDTATLLTLPNGMDDAVGAIELLEAELPGEHFHLDHLYRLYQPAMKNDANKDQRTTPASVNGATKCLDDRCYARSLIQWKDDLAACASDLRVGIIDTDVDLRHPTFNGQKIIHKSFAPNGRPLASNWHGTGVLALLAGRRDGGTPGLIDQARFFVASIFFAGDDGQPVTDTMSLLQALDWMNLSGVRLVNMSLAGMDDVLIRTRIASLASQGFVFTAAAGNEGPIAGPSYPAAYPQVIAVTAISKQLRIFPFANRGTYIDLAAPGVDVWTAIPDSREGYRSGTSFAVPFATALLAIQQQGALRQPKEKLLDQVKTVTLGTPGHDPTYGRGLLQAPPECLGMAASIAERPSVLDVAAR